MSCRREGPQLAALVQPQLAVLSAGMFLFATQQIFTGWHQLYIRPAALDRAFEPGAELAAAALQIEHERRVDPLNVDAAVLDSPHGGACAAAKCARCR